MKIKTTFLVMAILTSINCNALNYFWVGGSGSWSDFNNHWATTSGGNIFHNQVPQSTDNVYFDALSFTAATPTVTIDQAIVQCADMTWIGVFNTPTLLGASSDTLRIFGSLGLATGMNFNFNGQVSMEAITAKNITTSGAIINASLTFNGIGGSWTLQDALRVTNVIYLNNGNLNTNNKNVNSSAFYSNTVSTRSLYMGSSIFNLSNFNGVVWTINPTGMTLDAGTSTINGIGNGGSFTGGGFIYNDLFFTGIAIGNIYDDNTFHDVSFASDGVIYGSNTFHDVSFAGNATIFGNPMFGPNTFNDITLAKNGTFWSGNIFNNLILSPGFTYTLPAGQIQSVGGNICAQGTGALPIRIQSNNAGTPAIILKPSGTICWDYVHISDISATGGATFNAGLIPTRSQNLGGNTGLLFTGGCTFVSCTSTPSTCIPPIITTQPSPKSICANINAVFTVTASGTDLTYLWQVNPGSGFTNLTNTISYNGVTTNTLSVTGASLALNGFQYRCIVSSGICSNISNGATLTVNQSPIVTVNSVNICSGQTAILTATGAMNYSWSTGATSTSISVSPAITTSYSVMGTTNGCSSPAIAFVTVNPPPTVTVNSATICSGQTTTLIATIGTILIPPPPITPPPITPPPPPVTPPPITPPPPIPPPATPNTYIWSNGAITSSISVSPATTTTYTVTVTNNGCSGTAIATVTTNPLPTVTASVSSTTVTVSATGGTPPYTGTGIFNDLPDGTYSYTVTDANGCAVTTSVTVVADERSSSESSGPGVEWQNISWADEDIYDNFQPQINSGEDWWYSHKNAYSGSTQTGYITVGYSSLILRSEADFNQAKSVFNEGTGSPYNPINHDPKSNSNGSYTNYDFTGNSTFNTQEGCHDRDRINEYRTPTRGQVALNDINGNMLWCKSLCVGTLEEVIQDGNFFYVVGIHVGIRGYNDHTAFLAYNPTSPTPNTFNGVSATNKVRHLYIAKIDMNGTIMWQALYGMPDYVTSDMDALNTHSYGYDIIKSSSGKLIACGYGEEGTGMHHQPFIIELDPANGYISNKVLLPISSVFPAIAGNPSEKGEARSLVELANTGNYAVGCVYSFDNGNPDDMNEALVWCLGSNLLPSTSWATNPIRLPGTGIAGKKNSNIWEVKYHQAKQELLVPVVSACNFCTYAGNNDGKGIIYRYKNNGTLSTTGTNPSAIGPINAYDLRIGVEETTDGGFVSVSSRQTATGIPATVTSPTPAELGYLSTCYLHENIAADYPYWDTDPLITKFDLNGNKVWEKTFDIAPNRPREQPLGDLKQQECMYKISQTQDGGYTISGNSSHNYDDNYLVKLFSDCNLTQNYTVSDPTKIIDITSNTAIWNSSQKVIGSVHVKSGAILTITGSSTVIEFADSKLTGIQTNIFVELGGKLIVKNGATLTSILASTCPGSMWDGIIIGGSSLKQIAVNQGWVTLSSNCKIENARKGVYLSRVTGNPIASGGILQASNATFRNNYIDVEFTPYIAPLNNLGNEPNNLSYFKSCNFIGDAVLNDPSYTLIFGGRLTTDKHVILREVKGIRFTGNNFKTDLTSLGSNYSTLSRSYGIYSINASFNVHPDCSIINTTTGECAGTKNNFENLYHGIYAQSSNPLKSFTVNLTNFTNCYASLYQGGINYSKVTKNNFIINTTIPAPQYPLCLGGTCPNYFNYANQCSGFTYQENTFTVTGNQQVIGSLFNNTGASYKESYRNNYSGLKIGTQTQQNNGVGTTFSGLQIKCNQNAGVITSDIVSTSGVIPNQGNCITVQSPANNIFSHNGISEGDIKVASSASSFIYSHSVNPPAGLQVPLNYTTTKVTTNGCAGSFDYTTSCPSMLATGNSVNFQKSLVISSGTLADIAKQVLTNGNASSLYTAIISTMSAGNLKNALTNPGPYLSDGVLIAYLQRAATPPPGHIKDVVITNSPVTQPVKNVIDNLSLPNGIRNQINAAQTGTSARAQQETVVQSYEAQKQLAINDGISLLMTDTTIANVYAEMESFLILDNTLKGKTDLTNLYISNADYLKAQHLIDSLINLAELLKYATMLQHYNELQQQNKTWEELQNDAQLSNDITTLASDSLATGFANARSVLAMVNGTLNYDLIEDFVENGNLRSTSIQNSADSVISTINNDLKLNVYPNPFKDEINVRINYPINPANSRLQLMELATGKIIAEQIVGFKQSFVFNTAQLANGVYLVVLKGENVSPSYVKVIHLK